MLGPVNHVGYLAADLDATLAAFLRRFSVRVARHFERPEFALRGVYLGARNGDIELFTFTDPGLMHERLGERELLLHHVAYTVADLPALAAGMRAEGVRFAGPDGRGEIAAPVDLGGALHLWTVAETCWGQTLQLIQPPG
jgi:catechol 2,3-dioxygenase-like lactoylglutathione lyase family enzyme